jgi:hypothetical protein
MIVVYANALAILRSAMEFPRAVAEHTGYRAVIVEERCDAF